MIYTYENYCEDLDFLTPLLEDDVLSEGLLDKLTGVRGAIGEILKHVKQTVASAMEGTNVKITEFIKAFKDRTIFDVLKSFKFSLAKMMQAINKATGLINRGILKVFKELHKSKAFQQIASGAKTVDDFLDKYPILKKLTGPIITGILIYIWLNMTFVGNFDYDMDISSWFDALMGNYSIYDLFLSPEGMTMLAFLATGMLSGGTLSVAWLGSTASNLAAAITYVAFKRTKANPKFINNLKKKILRRDVNESTLKSFKSFIAENY